MSVQIIGEFIIRADDPGDWHPVYFYRSFLFINQYDADRDVADFRFHNQ